MPISTLYASPENNNRDLFCAFQPNRAMVPSVAVLFVTPDTEARFVWPAIPSAALSAAFADWLARMTLSGICSIRPVPKTGVGILKETLPAAAWAEKLSNVNEQPAAPGRR